MSTILVKGYAMIDVGNLRLDALRTAVERSYQSLDPFRKTNAQLIKEYAGSGYGGSTVHEKPLNKLHQAVEAYMMLLAANRPTIEITTHRRELRSFANHFELHLNALIKEISLEKTIRRWVLDAFFSMGVVRVHMADSGIVEQELDFHMDPGIPFASNVPLDDFVMDMSARTEGELKFIGNMYRIPYDDLMAGIETGMYDESASSLTPTSKLAYEPERVESFSKGAELDADEFEPMIDLCDIWIKRTNTIYTFPVDNRREFMIKADPIAEMEWTDDRPPYLFLSFNDVPNNVMPTSPAMHLFPMDREINSLMRKSCDQADRQKEILGYTPTGSSTAQNVTRFKDGDSVKMDAPREAQVFKFGGVDPGNQAFLAGLLDLFDIQAGNLTALMGLGAQADTVGQEQLIHNAGSRKIGQMQYRVLEATTRLVRSLGLLLWEDNFRNVLQTWEVPGTNGITVTSEWAPGDREGNFLDYEFGIGIYSMQYRPPSERAQAVNMLLSQIYIPMLQALMAQGGNIDFQRLNEAYAKMLDLPVLRDIITFANPMPTEDGSPLVDIRKPSNTTRTYVRKSQPSGMQERNKLAQTQQAWLNAANSGSGNGAMNGAVQ